VTSAVKHIKPPRLTTLAGGLINLIVSSDRPRQGRSDGGYIGIYTPPPNQSTLNFLWLFCLLAMTIVNIYTHPNQIPGYASGHFGDGPPSNHLHWYGKLKLTAKSIKPTQNIQ